MLKLYFISFYKNIRTFVLLVDRHFGTITCKYIYVRIFCTISKTINKTVHIEIHNERKLP